MNQDCIYAFVHIPKTAGTTFKYHINKYLQPEQRLYMGAEVMGLWEKGKGANYKDALKAAQKLINNNKSNRLKIIYGHTVPYGIHKYLSKPVRYFTFIREPKKRTISMYNYQYGKYQRIDASSKEKPAFHKKFLIEGRVPNFKEWLTRKYDPSVNEVYATMYRRLQLLGFIEKGDSSGKKVN